MRSLIRMRQIAEGRSAQFLVAQYDGSCSNAYVQSFCDYIGITFEQFWKQVHASANRELFDIAAGGAIRPRFEVGVGL